MTDPTPIRCANPASLPCVWDPTRCATHKLNEVEEVLGISVDRLLEQPVHTSRGEVIGPEGRPYGQTHDMDCPGCQDTEFLVSPRSETYWSS